MMASSDADILLCCINSVLYKSRPEPLNIDGLSEEFKKLGGALNDLCEYVGEFTQYARAIARGDFFTPEPSKENRLCWPLKDLRSNLKHLTWQTQQVAKGDYQQRVDFLGDFSEAFNTMIEQLREREIALINETERSDKKARALEETNELLTHIMGHMRDGIIVMDVQTGEIIYQNHTVLQGGIHDPLNTEFIKSKLRGTITKGYLSWEVQLDDIKKAFRVDTFHIVWQGREANAHIITDITAIWERNMEMEQYAYRDALTGVYNRRFCMEKLGRLIDEGKKFTICYMDIDHLKYVNDKFGHGEGDYYIQTVTQTLCKVFRKDDFICRIGGDEFVVILINCDEELAARRAEEAREKLLAQSENARYLMSISYGSASNSDAGAVTLNQLLAIADNRMYNHKVGRSPLP